MTTKLRPILFILLLAIMAGMAYSLNYFKFTDNEHTRFQDNPLFWSGDTLDGVIRSNDSILVMQSPVYTDLVITTASDFWRGTPYNPIFLGPDPIFNAPRLELPTHATQIRALATQQEHYFYAGDSMQARVQILGDSLKVWWGFLNTAFDTANFNWEILPDSAVLFFDCQTLHLFGTMSTKLIIGASGTVLFEDNLMYAGCDNRGRWINPNTDHFERFGLVAEGDIKVQNTFANGRNNSSYTPGSSGTFQTNQNLTSIVLCGIFASLGGSFTFEQQNDPDSGYVCLPCGCDSTGQFGGPDDRGYIYLLGSIYQRQRGFIHRQSCTSTGYLKSFHYDQRLRDWNLPLFDAVENELSAMSIDFGNVPVGQYGIDTLRMRNEYVPIKLDSFQVAAPFMATATPDTFMWTQTIPLIFAPGTAGSFTDTLRFWNDYYHQWFAVPLRGVATNPSGADDVGASAPARFDLQAYPNPFNAQAQIVYCVPQTGSVRLEVFDIHGRQVTTMVSENVTAGEHRAVFDGGNLPSGLYFAQLTTGQKHITQKLLLVK